MAHSHPSTWETGSRIRSARLPEPLSKTVLDGHVANSPAWLISFLPCKAHASLSQTPHDTLGKCVTEAQQDVAWRLLQTEFQELRCIPMLITQTWLSWAACRAHRAGLPRSALGRAGSRCPSPPPDCRALSRREMDNSDSAFILSHRQLVSPQITQPPTTTLEAPSFVSVGPVEAARPFAAQLPPFTHSPFTDWEGELPEGTKGKCSLQHWAGDLYGL